LTASEAQQCIEGRTDFDERNHIAAQTRRCIQVDMRFGVPQVESEDDEEEYTSYASQEYSSSEYDSDASIQS